MIISNRAERMINFIQTLKIPEGMHQGLPFRLREFQKKKYYDVYAPVWKSSCWNGECIGEKCQEKGKQTCIRVVRKAIYSVAKKNGKTPEIAGINLGHLIGPEAKRNEQLYSAAFERDQAAITYRYMVQMILMDEELSDLLIIRETKKEIFCPGNGSVFRALSSEVKGKHGLGPALLTMDELAQFGADRTFYDTLQQGRGAHLEPLLWIISTQAADDIAVLSEEIDTALKAQIPGPDFDPTVKIFFYNTPKDADPFDPESWKASNPAAFCEDPFLNIADLEEAARTARNMPSAEANFRNLRLNQRIDSEAHWISPIIWEANSAPPILDNPLERDWWGGLDLSQKNDLTSFLITAQDPETGHYDIHPFFWAAEEGLREKARRDKAPYVVWRDKGFLETTPGKTIDYAWVAQKIADTREDFNLVAILFDRYRIDELKKELENIGVDCFIEPDDWKPDSKLSIPPGLRLIAHGQGEKSMDPAIEKTEDLLLKEKIRHGMHPVLTWCVSNARTKKGPTGLRKFDKIKSTGRIDGAVTLVMAINGAVLHADIEDSGVGLEVWSVG